MKIYIKIFLLLLIPVLGMAQRKQIDSLKQALKATSNDTVRCTLLMKLSRHYNNANRDTAIFYADGALSIARKNKQPLTEAEALSMKSYELMLLKKYPESFAFITQVLLLAEDPESEKKVWKVISVLEDGLQTPHQQRISITADAHQIYGSLMGHTGNSDQQILQFQIAERLASEAKNFNLIAQMDMNLGGAYIRLNRLDSALAVEKKAESLMKQHNDRGLLGGVYYRLGEIYLKKGDTTLGLQYLHKGLNNAIEQKVVVEIIAASLDLTNYYLKIKQKDSSLFYARKLLETSLLEKSNDLDQAYQNLYQSFKLSGNTDSAYKYQGLALRATDSAYKATVKNLTDFQKLSFKAQMEMQQLETDKETNQTKVRTYVLLAAIGVLVLLAGIFYRNNRQKQKANFVLHQQKEEINTALLQLKATQTQLIQSEKMASLGELTAGIAHEIQNPLNFVNNFSEVNKEMLDELDEELNKGDIAEAKAIAADIKQNEQKINHHGKRADAIVKGMLEHSRTSTGQKEPTDINILADEYLRLAYHGLRAKDKAFNAELLTHFDENLAKVNIIPQDICRVLLNLFNNAFYAVKEKQKTAGDDYKPTVEVSTSAGESQIIINVRDNGLGIPDTIKDKIMQPFFTTKPAGEGTGLGLSLSYDIVVKGHGGKIDINSNQGEYTEFTITIPI